MMTLKSGFTSAIFLSHSLHAPHGAIGFSALAAVACSLYHALRRRDERPGTGVPSTDELERYRSWLEVLSGTRIGLRGESGVRGDGVRLWRPLSELWRVVAFTGAPAPPVWTNTAASRMAADGSRLAVSFTVAMTGTRGALPALASLPHAGRFSTPISTSLSMDSLRRRLTLARGGSGPFASRPALATLPAVAAAAAAPHVSDPDDGGRGGVSLGGVRSLAPSFAPAPAPMPAPVLWPSAAAGSASGGMNDVSDDTEDDRCRGAVPVDPGFSCGMLRTAIIFRCWGYEPQVVHASG